MRTAIDYVMRPAGLLFVAVFGVGSLSAIVGMVEALAGAVRQ